MKILIDIEYFFKGTMLIKKNTRAEMANKPKINSASESSPGPARLVGAILLPLLIANAPML